MKTKAFWKSKVFWFNAVTGILAIAQELSATKLVPVEYISLIIAAGNLTIRLFFSETKLTLK